MSEEISSLFELLNVAIGTPQRAVVNFSALHALLHEVLRHLDIREMKTTWRDTTPGACSLDAPVGVGALKQDQDPGQSDTSTGQRELQPGTELPERISSSSSSRIRSCEDGVSEDPGHSDTSTGERELQPGMEPPERISSSRIRSCEDGVSEAMKLIQELHREMKELCHQQKAAGSASTNQRAGCRPVTVEAETASDVEKCCHRVDALEESVTSLRDTVQKYPDPEELSHQCETWDLMQASLLSQRGDVPTLLVHSGLVDAAAEVNATHTPFNSNLTAGSAAPPPSSTLNPVEEAGRPAAPGALTTSGQTSMDAGTPPSEPPQQTGVKADQPAGSSLSERYSETLEALRSIGQLGARVAALEEGKADQSQLRHLREQISDESSQDALNHLMDQLNQQRALIDSLMSDREKLDSPEDMFMNLSSQEKETGSVASGGEESDSSASRELRQQDRKSVRKLEVKQLKAQLALCVERATDGDLQDQLDDLRGMLEDTMQSLTSQLSEAGRDESAGSQSKAQSREQRRENTGRKLSLLFQHYEQLQDTVSGLLQQQTGRPAGPPDLENVELMNIVQKAILEIQGECEKLHETTRSLSDDSRQKQSHIEELFKMTEKLEEKKADKQMVDSGIKAEKSALESKVSRLQFDSVTEQLNAMFHELLSKVTGQEQDWNTVMERLSTEMECKLNRMELDSVKEQLEDRWKNIHKKLQVQGALEHEDAAGIRKQLVDRFHCLSCDRPVVMHTPGQHLKLPSSGFPSHKSIRPFTVYALEQFRQHYRSLKPGTNRLNYEATVRRREQLQRSHAVMCSQMDSMQGTPRHGDRTGSCTTARENLIQSHSQTGERIYEGSRSCGGSHTLTSTNQRRTGLKTAKHHSQVEVDQSEEVDIIGLDGHIYKGRLNTPARNTETKLPTISTKDGKAKDKTRCSLPQKPAASPDVHHPLSVKSAQCSRSASSSSGRDWPVSALGCTSQSSVSPSAAAESSSERRADEPLGL